MAGRLGKMAAQDAESIDEEVSRYRNYLTRKEPSMRVSKKALTVAATWADMHQKPVMLGDIPWQLKRYNLLQENHLVSLQEMLTDSMYASHSEDQSLFWGSLRTCPEFLLHSVD